MKERIKNIAKGANIVIVLCSAALILVLILGHIAGEEAYFTMFLWSVFIGIIGTINTIALFSEE